MDSKVNKMKNQLKKNYLNKNLVTLENGTNLVLTEEHKGKVDIIAIQDNRHYRLKRIDNPLLLTELKAPVKPCTKLREAGFIPYIEESLTKMHISETFRIQSYSWPILKTVASLILINPPKSGKTMGYLPSLCGYCLFEDIKIVNRYLSPIVLILAPTASEVDDIFNYICRIDEKKKLRVIRAHQWFNKPVEMANGWDIVVATPMVFSKLLAYEIVTSIKSLDFLVLDNIQADCKYTQGILNSCDLQIKGSETQLIVVSENFNCFHEVIIKRYEMNLVIGAHLESAIYGGVQFVFKVLHKDKKLVELENILKDVDYGKMLIICKNKNEVVLLLEHLYSLSVSCLSVHENTEHKDIEEIHENWSKNGENKILICSDHVIPDLDITDATSLVHYSLPTTWTGFTYRYSTLVGNLSRQNSTKCYSYHLLDEDTVKQLPRIISFVERIGQPVDNNLKLLVDMETEKHEYEKASSGIDLCDTLLLLGHCSKSNVCIQRHKMTSYDAPHKHLITEGDVKFKILQVMAVDHYMALILSFRKPGEKVWHNVDTDNFMSAKCSLYFNNSKTAAISAEPKIGQICAVDMGDGVYERCEIKQINEPGRKSSPRTANIDLIDRGIKLEKINLSLFLELPEHLKQPSFIVSIRLANIKPYDDDRWCDLANNLMKNIINLPIPDEEYFTGKIMLVLQNIIWVEDACRGKFMSKVEVCTQSVKRQILDNDMGVLNKQHMQQLMLLYDKIKKNIKPEVNLNDLDSDEKKEVILDEKNINCNVVDKELNNDVEKDLITNNQTDNTISLFERILKWTKRPKTPAQSQLICGTINLEIGNVYEAYLTVAYDDDDVTFYIQLNENIENFNKMTKDIEEHMQIESNLQILSNPQKGAYCLIKCENGAYNRAKILNLPGDKTEEGDTTSGYSVFFIDYGDIEITQNVYVIENKFLSLPQQAIGCLLHNVKIDITVLEDIVNMLYEYSGVTWNITVLDIRDDGKYSVEVKRITEEKTVNLNEVAARFCQKAEELFQLSASPAKDISSVWNILAGLDDEDDCPDKIFEDLNELMRLYGTFVEDRPTATITEVVDEPPQPKIEKSTGPQIESLTKLTPVSNTPNIIWSQDDIEIMLKIQIPDVDTYTLRVANRHIYFRTTAGTGITYEFSINLFGPVVPAFTKHKALGPYVYVVCGKLLPRLWPNLYLGDYKLKFLTHDHEWKILDFTDNRKAKNRRNINYEDIDAVDPEDNAAGDSEDTDLESDDNELLDMMD